MTSQSNKSDLSDVPRHRESIVRAPEIGLSKKTLKIDGGIGLVGCSSSSPLGVALEHTGRDLLVK